MGKKKRRIYLLHFSEPFGHARHYLGSADDVSKRLDEHRTGYGARLTAAVSDAGINLQLVRIWIGDRNDERKLHNRHENPRLCPICNPAVKLTAAEKREIEYYERRAKTFETEQHVSTNEDPGTTNT